MLKRLIALLVMSGIALASPAVLAADQELSLWERLRKKIELLMPKKKLVTTTAAGGVRGSQADVEEVYWKGEAQPLTVDEFELVAFSDAIALADAGKNDEARAAFGQFVKQYPASTLRGDAEAALAQLGSGKQ